MLELFHILDILSEGIFLADENFNITYCNKTFLTYFGLVEDEVIGKNIMDIHSFKNKKEVKQMRNHFLSGQLTFWQKNIEWRERFLEFRIKAIFKEEKYFSLLGEVCDITLLKQKEQSHENLYKIYSLIIKNTQLGILIVDKNGNVTSINPAAEKILGISKEKILNRDFLKTMFKGKKYDDEGNYLSQIIETLETEREYQNLKKILRINGQEITILLDTCMLRDAKGAIIGVLAILKDITEYDTSESLAYRKEKYAVMAQLAAGLADEMRNPLTSVKGFMQIIHERMKKNRQKEYVELALDELKKMESLVRNFLLFSSPDAPCMKLASINKIIYEVARDYQNNFSFLTFTCTIPEEEFLTCVDEEQIRQALINILQNAVEAVPSEFGKIEIKLNVLNEDPQIRISVSDNGKGIPENDWTHIYEPFFTTKEFNSGLGLTIAKRIIEAHGGWLIGHNNPHGGVTMEIILPFGAYVTRKNK